MKGFLVRDLRDELYSQKWIITIRTRKLRPVCGEVYLRLRIDQDPPQAGQANHNKLAQLRFGKPALG